MQVNVLLKPPSSSTAQSLSADDFASHFTAKVDGIRSATECAPPPDIMHRAVPRLSDFDPVTTKEVIDIMNKLPPKHCDLDPVPTWLLKKATTVMAPVIGAMCNASLSAGVLPALQKHALVRPLLKKSTLDPDDLCSYRPITNLTFVSKMVERVVAVRLLKHVDSYNLLPER